MGLKEDIEEMKKEYQEIKEQSLAMEMLKDSKQANKRMAFCYTIIIIIMFISQIVETVYLIHTLNDIGTEETTTTETYEIEQEAEGNNNFINGSNNEVHN